MRSGGSHAAVLALAPLLATGCEQLFGLDHVVVPPDAAPDAAPDAPAPCTGAGLDYVRWRFDEGTGTKAIDDSGMHLLTLVNGATWVTDRRGGSALGFNGMNSSAAELGVSPLDRLTEFSYVAWIQPASAGKNSLGVIVAKGGAGASASKRFLINDGSTTSGCTAGCLELSVNRDGGTAKVFTITDTVSYGTTWYHVAATFSDTSQARIYVNGVETAYGSSDPGSGTVEDDVNTGISIGGWPQLSSNSGNFNGAIDDVRVYCRVLEAEEVSSLAAE